MPAERRPGMDHTLYPFSPIPDRPVLRWPGGASLALSIVLYLEYWELDPPRDAHRAPGVHGMWGHYFPDFRTYSYREYGNRVGIFRVLEVLDRHGIRATVAANASACERYPNLVRECLQRNYEIAAHGTHATRMITSRMSDAEERAVIAEAVAAVERATGRRPAGWFGQDFGESQRTPGLVAEAGLRYLADWPNDDQPYMMTVGRPLVSIPYHAELDDVQLLWLRQVPTWRYPGMVRDAAERLRHDGAHGGRLLLLGVHPWLFGRPHRIRYLDEILGHLRAQDGVWQATVAEVADAFLSQQP